MNPIWCVFAESVTGGGIILKGLYKISLRNMKISDKTQKYIDVIKREMEAIGVLSDADKENLEFLTTQVELYNRALDELELKGLTVVDKQNRTVVNPAFNVQRSAMANIVSLMKELSISARQRRLLVKDEMTDEPDPLDDFLSDMRGDSM